MEGEVRGGGQGDETESRVDSMEKARSLVKPISRPGPLHNEMFCAA